jgi:preprotein translocase subunit SecD
MNAGFIRAKRNGKAGSSGLFHRTLIAAAFLIALSSVAVAEPLAVELVSAQAAFDQRTSQPLITFKMTPASARLFAELTAKNVGRKMEIRIDGKAITAPVIREPILGDSGQISDNSFTVAQTQELAGRLSAGKAKIEFEIVND